MNPKCKWGLRFDALITKTMKIKYFTSLSSRIPSNLEVLLGRYTQSSPNPTEVSRRIDKVICHPLYNSWTYDNDLCLLKLSAPVNFTQNISPICLASEGSTFYAETNIWVTGWGNVLGDGKLTDCSIQKKHYSLFLTHNS